MKMTMMPKLAFRPKILPILVVVSMMALPFKIGAPWLYRGRRQPESIEKDIGNLQDQPGATTYKSAILTTLRRFSSSKNDMNVVASVVDRQIMEQ